jgi:hypothetical protein
MMLPMFFFVFALIVVGALASLVSAADPSHAHIANYIGPVFLFSGLGALCLAFILGLLFEAIAKADWAGDLGFLSGYVLGLLAGAILGLRRALTRSSRNQM